MPDMTTQFTHRKVRASTLVSGEVATIGGLTFTRLDPKHKLTRHSVRQKARDVELTSVVMDRGFVQVGFMGGDCPETSREMFVFLRPCELVALQVQKEG